MRNIIPKGMARTAEFSFVIIPKPITNDSLISPFKSLFRIHISE